MKKLHQHSVISKYTYNTKKQRNVQMFEFNIGVVLDIWVDINQLCCF